MRLLARWTLAVVTSAAAFVLSWWVCRARAGLDEGVALAIAGAVLGVVLAPAGWWAVREPRPKPTLEATRRLPKDSARRPPAGPARFHFRARAISLQGYEEPLAELRRFLEHDDPFRWWMITGEAGTGKSRLALEVCEESRRWEAGFIPRFDEFGNWEEWQPTKPTLLVVDYVAGRVPDARRILTTLSRRRGSLAHRVRVLLLERREDIWLSGVLGTGGDRYLLIETRYREAPLHLTGLDDKARWGIVRETFRNHSLDELPNEELVLNLLQAVDPAGRPLFVALIAEVLASASGAQPRFTDMRQVLSDITEREVITFWDSIGATDRDKNLLTFVTIVGGLPVEDLRRHANGLVPGVDEGSTERFDASRYQAMTGQDSRNWLAPLEPDIIGEFFVLEHLQPRDSLDDRAGVICEWAREFAPVEFLEFLLRAHQDLGAHEVLDRMRPTLDSEATKRLLESAGSRKDEALTVLASIHGVRVGILVLTEEFDAAWETFNKLLALAKQQPGNHVDTVASVAGVWLVLIHLAADDGEGALSVIEILRGSVWPQKGQLNEPLEAFIAALVFKASEMTLLGDLATADKLAKGAVATAQVQEVETEVAGILAAGLARLVEVYTDRAGVGNSTDFLTKASDAQTWIRELAGRIAPSSEFVFHWAFAAGMVLDSTIRTAGKFKILKQEPFKGISMAAYESLSQATQSELFDASMSSDAANTIRGQLSSFAAIAKAI